MNGSKIDLKTKSLRYMKKSFASFTNVNSLMIFSKALIFDF